MTAYRRHRMELWRIHDHVDGHANKAVSSGRRGCGNRELAELLRREPIDKWMIPYFGASVYDNPAVYAKSSPITFIKQVKTPTLVVVGERDGECPSPQSFEFWHALKTLGVPTELVVYPARVIRFTSRRTARMCCAALWRGSTNTWGKRRDRPHINKPRQSKLKCGGLQAGRIC